ncbi:asparagine synthase (glutamine-hydrolyzing) [candidate division KSB1 bacterium]|nr:asparagine synthase (glutamine-hydrolyzing) [candidate division KSB1 bacterium]RQW03726.1 MAG: asparagine synthase (glutamine-hydrolyzing) [candidate division KSB1 bacterium]
MCGIVGIINKAQQPIDLHLLKAMADVMHYRGPDDEGYHIDGSVGLYHKRLSIIDLSTGHQPMVCGANVIVFNGEIFNYVELREKLSKKGHQFKTRSDTEVILKMYEEYDLDCIARLNGMFAFLLYDKSRNRMIAARDHFGIKPLYCYFDESAVLYASEIKALLQHPSVTAEPNYAVIGEYLTFQFVLDDLTLFKGIVKVLPGHYQVIDLLKMNIHTVKYWEPSFAIDSFHTEAYFVAELKRLLDDTVGMQMRSDVPVGTYLSGGLDSSIVTLLAAQKTAMGLKTFTGAFHEGAQFNETGYAREVARTCGAEVNEVFPTVDEFVELLPVLIYHLDEPVAGPGLFPQYIVSRLAVEKVKVVLGGQGGDEIFGGYARYIVAYLEQALKGAIFETNEEGEHIVSLQSILPNLPSLHQYIPMLREFWRQGAFEPMDQRYFQLIDRNGHALELFSKEFLVHYNKQQLFNRFQQLFNHPDTLSFYNKMTHFDMVASLPALLQVEDRVSMAVSLESRVPLLDRRIVDLITSMPPAMKFKGAESKYILKKAMGDVLPRRILERKDKMGFPVPLHIWAKERARQFFCDILLSETSRQRGIFNLRRLKELIHSEREFGRQLWGMLCLEIWFNEFIDKKPTSFEKHKIEIADGRE